MPLSRIAYDAVRMSTPCENRRRALPDGETLPANPGTVVSVRGSVVEAQFERHPPCINSELRAGADNKIVIEVLAQSDGHRVRGVALTPTEGLARGTAVEDTGGPLHAPVAIDEELFDLIAGYEVLRADRGPHL